MNSKKGYLILLIIFVLIITGCIKEREEVEQKPLNEVGEMGDGAILPISPVRLNVALSNAPALGQLTEIRVIVTYIGKIKEGMPEMIANISLSNGFELISGNLTWRGETKAKINFSVIVKAVKIGNWTIEGNARIPPTGDTWMGEKDFIYITVLEDNAVIKETPFQKPTEPCIDRIIDGELTHCTTTEPTGNFVETKT